MEEAEFQGFEELKTDIKAEDNVDEEFSFPVWHKVEGPAGPPAHAHEASATTENPEDSAQESPVAPHDATADSITIETPPSTVEDDEPPLEVRPVALSDEQRKLSREYSVVEVDEESDSEEEEADFGATTEVSGGEDGGSRAADPSAAAAASTNSVGERSMFRCIMCEKVFRHADNLKVHLQSHLGTRAKLKSCGMCRDGFSSPV